MRVFAGLALIEKSQVEIKHITPLLFDLLSARLCKVEGLLVGHSFDDFLCRSTWVSFTDPSLDGQGTDIGLSFVLRHIRVLPV